MRKQLRYLPVLVFAALALGLAAAGHPASAAGNRGGLSSGDKAATSPLWEVSGIFAQACVCTVPCPCWRGKEPI